MWTKEAITEHLNDGIVNVRFTKKDGSIREMRCSLNENYLPVMIGESIKKENPDVVSVWDIDIKGWRSFRLDSIIDVRIVND
jgi:hypothetical protein